MQAQDTTLPSKKRLPRTVQATPALSIPLSHVHLIEASAGTGKTWTLTALVVRLLVEGRRPPEQLIATTFTRAASAEMRQRIGERIATTKKLLEKVLLVLPKLTLDLNDLDNALAQLFALLSQDAEAAAWLEDPLNAHIVKFLLHDEAKQSVNHTSDSNQSSNQPLDKNTEQTALHKTNRKKGFLWAKNHLEVTLIQLDKLFVSTLDSLCQKLLREFAFDMLLGSGQLGAQGKPLELIQGAELDSIVHSLTHDAIRIWRTREHYKNPQLMPLLAQTKRLRDVDYFESCVKTGLNFLAEPLEAVDDVVVDIAKLDEYLARFESMDDGSVFEFLLPSGEQYTSLYKGRALHKHGIHWHTLKNKLMHYGAVAPEYLTSEESKLFEALAVKIESNFSPKNKDAQAVFERIAVVQLVQAIFDYFQSLQTQLDALQVQQNEFVTRYVRTQLAPTLLAQGKTTFALQLRALNDALEGNSGKWLAQQIRHRYPVALIDEFQDVNADQAGMIYSIYQRNLADAELKRGCVLLVGDPKQAIYGFRGGDIVNYQRIKASIPTHNHHTLDTNRRSQKRLISGLNDFFGSRPDLLEHVRFEPVNAHGVDEAIVDEQGEALSHLLRHFSVKPSDNTAANDTQDPPSLMAAMADKITQLLTTHRIQHKDGSSRALKPDEIAVLFRSRFDVVGLEYQLHKRGVPTFAGNDTSVFATSTAQDLAALMQALLMPHHLSMLRRALASCFFGLTKAELDGLLDELEYDSRPHSSQNPAPIYQAEPYALQSMKSDALLSLADIQYQFSEAAKRWQQFGFLAGWQYLAEHFSLWQRLASGSEGERRLVDVRHLLDIMQTQAQQHDGASDAKSTAKENAQLAWFLRQLSSKPSQEWALQRRLPSKDGVQLMSIHKSKGLEFAVVFVLGVDNTISEKKPLEDLYLTTKGEGRHKRIVLTTKAGDAQQHAAADMMRSHAEGMRVTYVAFTRPSQLLYLVTADELEAAVIKRNKKAEVTAVKKNPLSHWLVEDKQLRTEVANIWQPEPMRALSNAQYDATCNIAHNDTTQDGDRLSVPHLPTPPKQPSKTRFTPWYTTSFSALARQLEAQHTAIELAEYTLEGQIEERAKQPYQLESRSDVGSVGKHKNQSNQSAELDSDALRFDFPRGANAGSFLHKVFERLDFAAPIDAGWLVGAVAERYGMAQEFNRIGTVWDAAAQQATCTWLAEVLRTPLTSGVCLQDTVKDKRLAELSFNLGLPAQSFSAGQLSKTLQQAGLPIRLPPQTKVYRYLVGEIDLVYEANGRYYVLDYKSNHLGGSFADYDQASLTDAMNHAGYWLQAAIYLLALHRYLRVRLLDYDPARHLGGVEYAFIRGMHPRHVYNNQSTGVIGWLPSVEVIHNLDAVFGMDG